MLFKDLEKHGSISAQHHLNLALKKLNNQDQLLINQNHLISELQTTVATQRGQTQLLMERLNKVENNSDILLFLQDEHVWNIPQFSEEVKKASQKTGYYLSKQIYTSKGYRLQCMLYPRHRLLGCVSIYFQSIVGNFDQNLAWPMTNIEIKSCIIDKDGGAKKEQIVPTTGQKSFNKPPHSNGQRGIGKFLRDSEVQKNTFNDVLTIRIQISHL